MPPDYFVDPKWRQRGGLACVINEMRDADG